MTNTKNIETTFEHEVLTHAIDKLKDGVGVDEYGCDLHNKLFNEDYFVIGYYQADQLLLKYGIFAALGKIRDYEKENFGEITTDFSDSEKVANMLAYVLGEEYLNECEWVESRWDDKLTQEDCDEILEELKDMLEAL